MGRPASGLSARLEAIALPVMWVVVAAVFSFLRPNTFPTLGNASSILASQAVLLLVALALIIPLTANDFDLSVAAVAGLSAMVIAILNASWGWPVGVAILCAIAVGAVIGFANGALTVFLGIESLVVTLGMSTLVTGVMLWISGTRTITGVSADLIEFVIRRRLFGIPYEFYYGLAVVAILWYVFNYTPLGQRLLVVGRGREVARLSGIRVGRIRLGAMVASAIIASIGGVLLVGTSGSAGPTTGIDLLLPAFAAAFLGSTTIKPGRFNPWGTAIAVYFLVTGITGLQLLGGETFVQNLFYGVALIGAVAFSQVVKKRRSAQTP